MDAIENLRSRHLDEDDKIHFSINETAKIVHKQNYGERRFLAELVIMREKSEEYQKYDSCRQNTQKLRELLESGWY